MSDKLRMDYINSLPQPFLARQRDGWEWPVNIIDVETATVQINVMGKSQVISICDVKTFVDAGGGEHDPDTFWADYEAPSAEVKS